MSTNIENANDNFRFSVDTVIFTISRQVLRSHGDDNLLLNLAESSGSLSSVVELRRDMVDPPSFWSVWKHLHCDLDEDDLEDMDDESIDRLLRISDYLCLPALHLQLECTQLNKKKCMTEREIKDLKRDKDVRKMKEELDRAKLQITALKSELQSEKRPFRCGGHYTHDNRDRCTVRCKKPDGHAGYCKF